VGEVSVAKLDVFAGGEVVDAAALRSKGFVKGRFDVLKVLGNGNLSKELVVRADAFSAGARAKIEAAGGRCEVVARVVAPIVRHKHKPKFA